MNLLITGIAGFIGTNFLDFYLKKNSKDRLVGLDKLTYAGNMQNLQLLKIMENPRFKFVRGDINNTELVKELFNEYNFDTVINLAAESHVDRSILEPSLFLKTNVLGTQNLLHICKDEWVEKDKNLTDKKFFQISTDEVYGSLGTSGYFTEQTPLDPRSPYSASKASADMLVKAYHETFGLPTLITRCSNNYGPFQFPEKLIPLIIQNALEHKPIPVYGDGKNIRDWLYVDDHCQAIDLVLKKGNIGEVYNIGGHNERENINIVKTILMLLKQKTNDSKINESLITFVRDRLGHDKRYAIDPSKITSNLGWEPSVSIEQGLEKTIDWYLTNKEWTKSVISGEYLDFYKKNYKL